ncbi:MAG: RNA polymerase sigma factor [Puniceicoccales bacterium]
MPENDDDSQLIQRIAHGDEHALACLMGRYKEPLFRFTYRYLGNESDSSVITEEAFYRVYQNAARYSPRAAVKTWIFSIALNLCRDRLRRQKKHRGNVSLNVPSDDRQGVTPLLESIDAGGADPHQELQSSDAIRRINIAIQALPEKLRFPFVFCVLEEHAYDECAAILKTSRKTVETRIYRARKWLREKLANLL